MKRSSPRGMTLVEVLIAMAISTLLAAMIVPWFLSFQEQSLREISRTDLQERAERLLRFLSNDLCEAALQTGPRPRLPDATPLALVHDSLAGDPVDSLAWALLPADGGPLDHDRLTMVKAISFVPPLLLDEPVAPGDDVLSLNRTPNRPPASSREMLPMPEAISHVVLANQATCYAVTTVDRLTSLQQPVQQATCAGTELMGVRAYQYALDPYAGSGRLRRDDYTSREILDDAVDGLQFEYLLADGTLADQPADPGTIRGVVIHLLVRDLRQDSNYLDRRIYQLANRTYGPYHDHYRRVAVMRLVAVRNHGT